jgi:glutaredoxin
MEPITICNTWRGPDFRRAKAFLKERGVEFQEVNTEEDLEGGDIVLRANEGSRKVPTLKVGESYFACSPCNTHQLADELKIPLNR